MCLNKDFLDHVSVILLNKYRWLYPSLLIIVAAVVLFTVSPVYRPIPSVDPSVYLYVGRQILEGKVPYRDAWDHKQPLVYLVYAFGQWITPGSLWGVWLTLWIAISSTAVIFYRLLLRKLSQFLSFLSISAGLLALFPILWGGSVEEFSLPFQALAVLFLALILSARNVRSQLLFGMCLGVVTACGFFLKQNLIAAGVASLAYLLGYMLTNRNTRVWVAIAAAVVGAGAVASLFIAYFGIIGALDRYWNAAFVFNYNYAGLGLKERFLATLDALEFISSIPGLLAAWIAWITCALISFIQAGPWLARILKARASKWVGFGIGLCAIGLSVAAGMGSGEPGFGLLQKAFFGGGAAIICVSVMLFFTKLRVSILKWLAQQPVIRPLVYHNESLSINLTLFSFLYFPTILAFLTLSGRNYVYYFIPFIPFLMISFGAVSGSLLSATDIASRKLIWAFVLAAWIGIAYFPILQLSAAFNGQRFQPLPDIVLYVDNNTHENETILVWGKPSTYVYTLTSRNAPTRYFYQAPVSQVDYNEDFQVSAEILQNLQAHPPRLFLYAYESEEPIPTNLCPLPQDSAPNSPGAIFQYICTHYQYKGQISEFLVFMLP